MIVVGLSVQILQALHLKTLDSLGLFYIAQIFQVQIYLARQVSRKKSSVKLSIIKITRPLIALKVWNSQKIEFMSAVNHTHISILLSMAMNNSVGGVYLKYSTNC